MNLPSLPASLWLRAVENYRTWLAEQGLSEKTIENYLSDLRCWLTWLNDHPGLLDKDLTKAAEQYLEELTTSRPISTVHRRTAALRRFADFLTQKMPLSWTLDQKLFGGTGTRPSAWSQWVDRFGMALNQSGCNETELQNLVGDVSLFLSRFPQQDLEETLTKHEVAKYQAELQERGASASDIAAARASLARFALWATQTGFFVSNPLGTWWSEFLQAKATDFSTVRQPSPETLAKLPAWRRWYLAYHRLPFTTALHLAVLVVFASMLSVFAYQQFGRDVSTPFAYPSEPVRPNRQLSFQGRLTDSVGTPITAATDVVFRLYDADSSGTELWDSGTCSIDPDQDGIFSTALGDTCGTEIPEDVFSEMANVWLEIEVGGEILSPRQQISSVPFALNTETVQGFPVSLDGEINTIPVINALGQMIIGASNPSIIASSGAFLIQGESLTFATEAGGNITLQPGVGGTIEAIGDTNVTGGLTVSGAVTFSSLTDGLVRSTAGVLSGGGLVDVTTEVSGVLPIANGGTNSTATPTAGGIAYGTGTAYAFTAAGSSGECLISDGTNAPAFGSCAGAVADSIPWQVTNGAANLKNTTLDLLVGGNSTASAKFALLNVNSGTPIASISAGTSGSIYFTASGSAQTTARQDFHIGGGTTGNIVFNNRNNTPAMFLDTVNSRLGLGKTNPAYTIDAAGSLQLTGTYSGATTLVIAPGGSDASITATGNNSLQFNTGLGWIISQRTGNTGYGALVLSSSQASRIEYSGGAADAAYMGFFTRATAGSITERMRITGLGYVGIGTTAPTSNFHLEGFYGNNALARFNQTGSGDILTASASGTTRFTVSNTGAAWLADGLDTNSSANRLAATGLTRIGGAAYQIISGSGRLDLRTPTSGTALSILDSNNYVGIGDTSPAAMFTVGSGDLFQVNSSGAIAAATGLTSSGTITLSAFTNNGGLLYTDGSGVLAQTAVGANGECLISSGGGAPTFGSCSAAVAGVIPWQVTNGTANLKNTTLDLLVGGTSTASADFAVLNVNGTGPATASVSGNLIVMPKTGLGGNVGIGTVNPLGMLDIRIPDSQGTNALFITDAGTSGSIVMRDATNNAATFEPNIRGTSSGAAGRSFILQGNTVSGLDSGSTPITLFRSTIDNGAVTTRPLFQWQNNTTGLMTMLANGNLGLGTATPGQVLTVIKNSTGQNNATIANYGFTVGENGSGDLALGDFGTYKAIQSFAGDPLSINPAGNNVGIGTTGPDAKIDALATSGEQLRLTYTDGSVYTAFSVNSSGNLTIDNSGTTTTFSDALTVNGTTTLNGVFVLGDHGDVGSINTSDWDISTSGVMTGIGNITSDGNIVTTGYVQGSNFRGGLYYNDNRAASPSEFDAQEANYVFGSFSNNTTSPYSDGFVFRGWSDSSGGSDNMINFSRASIAARFYQQTYGSATDFTTYEEFAFTGTGGTANYIPKYSDANTIGNSAIIDVSGNIGIGDTTPDNKFTVGTTSQFQVNTTGAIAAATGITSSGTITFSAFTNNGGLLYTNGSGVLAQTAVGSSGECLVSAGGGSPTWGSCSSAVSGVIPWQVTNGTANLKNNTLDLLVGGSSTTSAKFAFTNVNSGNPTLKVSPGASTTIDPTLYLSDVNDQLGFKLWYDNDIGATYFDSQYDHVAGSMFFRTRVEGTPIDAFTIHSSGNVGVGDTSPDALFSVGATSQFLVNSSGIISRIDGVAHTIDDVSGNLTLTSNSATVSIADALSVTGTITATTDETLNGVDINAGAISDVTTLTVGGNTILGDATTDTVTVNGLLSSPFETAASLANLRLGCTGSSCWTDANGAIEFYGTSASHGQMAYYPSVDGGSFAFLDSSSSFGDKGALTSSLTFEKVWVGAFYADGAAVLDSTLNVTGNSTFTGTIAANGTVNTNSALNVNSTLTIGDASSDTVTVNSNAWTFANDTNFALTGGTNGLSFDTSTLSIDAANDRVGIGTTAPVAKLNVSTSGDGTLLSSGTVFRVEVNGSDNAFAMAEFESSVGSVIITNAGRVGIGDTSPAAALTVGSGDLFQVNSSGAIAAATGITSSGTITFSGLSNGLVRSTSGVLSGAGTVSLTTEVTGVLPIANGGTNSTATPTAGAIAYGTGTAYAFSAVGTTGECLQSNGAGAPTWGSCAAGSSNFWTIANGAIYPTNDTTDMLIGGTSSASAKFAFLNVTTGTPTASVSAGTAGATYITATGTLGSTAGQNLTLAPSGTARLTVTNDGNVGIGTTAPRAALDVDGHASTSGALYFTGTDFLPRINMLNNQNLQFRTSRGGDSGLSTRMTFTSDGDVAIGSHTPEARLHVNGGSSRFTIASGNNQIELADTLGTYDWAISQLSDDLRIQDNNNASNTVLTIQTVTGNLGLGDTSPDARFTVGSTSQFQVNSSGIIASIDGVAHTIDDVSGDLTLTSNSSTVSIADALSVTGTITANTAETINGVDINAGTVSDVVNLTINSGGDLTIGAIGLNDVGSDNITSGASLVGVFDEFVNSSSTTVQDVLDDLDAAIGAAGSWNLAGDSGTPQTILSTETANIVGGTNGIDTIASATDILTINLDTTEIGTTTFGSGSGLTWTFDAGATDPTIAFASNALTFTAGTNTFAGNVAIGNNTLSGGTAAIDFTNFDVSSGGNVTIGGTLDVTGIGTFVANLNADGGFDVDNAFVVANGGVLTTSQPANFDSTADFDGNVEIADTNIAFDGASTTFTTTGAFTITPGGSVLIGDGGDTLQINSSNWDVSSGGAISGLTGVTSSGTITFSGLSNGLVRSTSGVLSGAGTVSLTTEVTGVLPIANGGTNSTATPTNGGVAYGTGTAFAFTSAGTAGECLVSNGAAAPTWGACVTTPNYWQLNNTHNLSASNLSYNILLGHTATASANTILNADGSAVFNEQGLDRDFRIETDVMSHAFFVDASTDRIGFGTSTPAYQAQFHNSANQADFAITTDVNVGSSNTTQLSFVSDLNGTPSYASLGQYNTGGLRFSGAGNLVTPDMFLDTNGEFGIGTIAPASKLHVESTGSQLSLGYDSDSTAEFLVDMTGMLTIWAHGEPILLSGPTQVNDVLTVGAGAQFVVDATGVITKIDNVAHTIDDVSGDLTITSNSGSVDINDALAVTGAITASTAETINGVDISAGTVSDVVNLTINAGGDLTIGAIGLNDVGTTNITSGASLVGTFDEFGNSASTTVQDVLDDLDDALTTALAGAYSGWTLAGDSGSSQTISSGNTANIVGGTNGIDTIASATDTLTLNLDYTEITTATFGTGTGWTWTFNTGTTDPTIGFADGAINLAGGNLTLGASSETMANTGFVMDGNDLFVAGMAGFEGNVYTDGAFIAGASTSYGNGTISQSTGETLTIGTTNAGMTLQTTTAGDITLNPVGDVRIASALRLDGTDINGSSNETRITLDDSTDYTNLIGNVRITNGVGTVNFVESSGDLTITPSGGQVTAAGDYNVTTGNDYQINGTVVLNATTLGSGVTASSLTSVGTLTNLTVAGTITANTAETINGVDISAGTVSDVVNLTINSGGDLTIGGIALSAAGSSSVTSGASILGVFDEFTNSSGIRVQDVLADLDSAITTLSSSGWTLAGDSGTQTISMGNTANIVGGTNGIDTIASATDILTLNLDTTEIGTTTFGSGSAITWTFNASGGTDATMAFGDGSLAYDTATMYLNATTNRAGFGTTGPGVAVEINDSAGSNLRLTYNDNNGSPTTYTDFLMSSGGVLTIDPTGGQLTVDGDVNVTTGNDYRINGTVVLNATTLGSGVTASSLTSVGTLTSLSTAGAVNINTGVSTTVNIGNNAGQVGILTGSWDITTAGVASGFTGITTSGSITKSDGGGYLVVGDEGTTNEGGHIVLNGWSTQDDWNVDLLSNSMRFFNSSSNTTEVQIFNAGAGVSSLNVEGYVLAKAGTNSSPSFTFSGDADTGMYSSGSNIIEFTAGGFKALEINSSIGLLLSNSVADGVTCSSTTEGALVYDRDAATLGGIYYCRQTGSGVWQWRFIDNTAVIAQNPDLAEYAWASDLSLDGGDIVSVTNASEARENFYDRFNIVRASSNASKKVLGVVSSDPGIILNKPDTSTDIIGVENAVDPHLKPLTLAGRVPVKVVASAPLEQGDRIGLSEEFAGIGKRLTGSGYSVGTVLTAFNPTTATCTDISHPSQAAWSNSNKDACFRLPDGRVLTKVLVLVNNEYSLADASLQEDGSFTLGGTTGTALRIVDELGNQTASITASGSAMFRNAVVQEMYSRFMSAESLLVTGDATVEGTLSAQSARFNALQASGATVSGTLYAENLVGNISADSVQGLEDRIAALVAAQTASMSAAPEPDPETQGDIDTLAQGSGDGSTITLPGDLIIQGLLQADGGIATNTLLVDTTALTKDSLAFAVEASCSAEVGCNTFAIQPSGEGTITFLNNLVVMSDGSVTINGDLTVTGKVAAGQIETDLIQMAGEALTIDLASAQTSNESTEGENTNVLGELIIRGIDNQEVAAYSADGSARFQQLTLQSENADADSDNEDQSEELEASSGTATLKSGKESFTIRTTAAKSDSLVYLTATSSTDNKLLFVENQEDGEFTVTIDGDAHDEDITFNWWVVGR